MSRNTPMTEKEAAEKISVLLAKASASLTAAQKIADESGVDFSWDGPTYGMGGRYSARTKPEDVDDDWESSGDDGWMASSHSC